MKRLFLLLWIAACGGKSAPPANPAPPDDELGTKPAPVEDTPIHKRRDAACEQLGPRLTQCAIEDAKAAHNDEALKDIQKVAPVHTKKFVEQCEGGEMSSRQVRVLEVCFKEAPDCAALGECLKNLDPKP